MNGDLLAPHPSSRAPHKELINAVKQLAVSTGKLRPLLILHIRPIDPVVFREPMYKVRETSSCGGFHAYMPSAFILAARGYPAMPQAGQLEHQRCVLSSPLVLGEKPLTFPAPTTDRDRPVSRRSKPSSRTAFIGEQPNPWELLHPQDAMSRHRTFFHSFLWCRLCLHPVVGFSYQLSAISFQPMHDLTLYNRSRRIATIQSLTIDNC